MQWTKRERECCTDKRDGYIQRSFKSCMEWNATNSSFETGRQESLSFQVQSHRACVRNPEPVVRAVGLWEVNITQLLCLPSGPLAPEMAAGNATSLSTHDSVFTL